MADENKSEQPRPSGVPRRDNGKAGEVLAAAEAAVADLVKRADAMFPEEQEELTFPERPSAQQVKITRKREYGAWVGKRERLIRIEQFVYEALRRAFEADKTKIEEEHTSPYMRKAVAEQYVPETRVTGGAGRLERTGDLATILSDMDTAEVEWVRIENSSFGSHGQPRVSVTFGQKGSASLFGGGVEIEVSGSDKQWVAGVYDTLVSEVAKDVPWWVRLISEKATIAYTLGTYAIVMGALFLWGPSQLEGSTLFGVGLASAIIGFALHGAARKWVFVNFELLGPGERSTARKVGSALMVTLGFLSAIVTIWVFLRE